MGTSENQSHAKQKEFDSYVELVDGSKMLMSEKESCRRLLATSYGNTNGDPPEVKQKKMCEFDWELSKHIVHMRVLLSELIRTVGDKGATAAPAKPAAPASKWDRILDRLTLWRNQIAAVAIAAFFAPHSVDVINALKGFTK